jgi:hypothetical protein
MIRLGLPAGTITPTTLASLHESGAFEEHDVSAVFGNLLPTGNVVAVEVHQAGPSSSDLALDLELLTSDQAALVSRGPYLQMGCPDAMTVKWRTNRPTDSRVCWGTSPTGLVWFTDDPAVGTVHVVTVAGLSPDTEYFYSVGTTAGPLAGGDPDHRFRTSPPVGSDEPVRVWLLGDSGELTSGQINVRDAYMDAPGYDDTDLWIMLGDNAYGSGTDEQYQTAVFLRYADVLRRFPLWTTRGNHDDLRSGAANDYYDFFELPISGEVGGVPSGTEAYYSFDYANLHFVCLDSDGSDRGADGPMVDWLRQDLAMNTQDWTIAFWHHPPYTKGSHDSDTESNCVQMRQNVLPVADSLGVDLVLTGHSHSYERSFLLNGHYDVSSTLTPEMVLDDGDGRDGPGGDGAYEKATLGSAMGEGAVYIVAGSSSKHSGGPLDHPAMFTSQDRLGSVVLESAGSRLDVSFLDDNGIVRDDFAMLKPDVVVDGPSLPPERGLSIAAGPNPFVGGTRLRWTVPNRGAARVRVMDVGGRVIRILQEGDVDPGTHESAWNGRDEAGHAVTSGVYFVTLEHGGQLRAAKVVRAQ